MTYTKSKTQTPRDYEFPSVPPLPPSLLQSVKPQTWCLTSSVNPGDIAIQTTNGDFLVLCSFEFNSNQQQIFTRLQTTNLSQI